MNLPEMQLLISVHHARCVWLHSRASGGSAPPVTWLLPASLLAL